ncbi:MAG: Maf family protein [Anaerolineae bacterium]
MTQFVLASSSPRRQALLKTLRIPFSIHKPDIDESQYAAEPPLDYVQRLSREKASRIAAQLPIGGSVLAADTVVILSADTLGVDETGEILGKPTDASDARRMLQRLRGRTHQVCTAITLLKSDKQAPLILTEVTRTDVTMRDYSDAEIDTYIATGDPFDKAGSYAIQHPIFQPVARVAGCYGNVVGLPLCTLQTMLPKIGWELDTPDAVCHCQEICAGLFF